MSKSQWKPELRLKLAELVDSFVVAGAKQSDIFEAIIDEVAHLRAALKRDPDPAEDDTAPVEEPANDWPGADRS